MPTPSWNVTDAELALKADSVIRDLAGSDATVRPDQLEAVRALVVEHRRALVVQATGWGKSAVYWIAAKAIRDAGGGPTLVVSPLLALMRNQVEAAGRAGLRAATLNSSNNTDWRQIEQQLLSGEIDVLLVSPERLANPTFAAQVLAPLLGSLGLLVIDEAHCISSWGHDFRPDYQRLARLLTSDPNLPVLATTATANKRVTDDVAHQLGDRTLVLRGSLTRESLHLSVVPTLDPLASFAWVDEALRVLDGSGIVYVLTVEQSEQLAEFLTSREHHTVAYNGSTETDARARIEDDLRANRVKAVIATSALGMGYDKPDLAFCIHVGSPQSPVDYYQQVGRAGRALDRAVVVLIPGGATDERLWEYFATSNIPRENDARAVLNFLGDAAKPASVNDIEISTGLNRSRVELLLKILAVDDATDRTTEGWIATGASWQFDAPRYEAVVAARRAEASIMRRYARGQRCLETLLRQSLDDPVDEAAQCGRCSVCTGVMPASLPTEPSPESVAAARTFLRGRDKEIEPRKQFTRGIPDRRGNIPAAARLQEGRSLAFADDPAWPEVIELVRAGDGECPEWAVDASIDVLGRWASVWVARPTMVVPMPSIRHPQLVHSLAAGIAARGRLQLVDALEWVGPAQHDVAAPAQRAINVSGSLRIRDGVSLDNEVVLLVDDTARSRWTLTFAGIALGEAGARGVLPLVLHRQPG